MQERLTKLRRSLTRPREISFLEGVGAHVRSLSPSDKLVAGALGALVVFLSLASLYSFEQHFLVEVPSHGGSLTEGVLGSPRFVNPLLALSDADNDLVSLTYAGLMGHDKDGVLVPVLAEGYSISEDGKTYTFVLRDGLRFSDGSPITAEDVVFTIEKAQDPSLKSPQLANWANIRAETVDARTVRFTLPKPYAPFLSDATLGILPAHIWRDVTSEEFPFAPEMIEPVGAGPFEVTRVVRDRDGTITRYELRPFNGYALSKPYLDRLTFVFFENEEGLADAVLRGRVESAHSVAAEGALYAPYSRVFGVFFNQSRNPLFARIEVRKALSQALDREYLVQDAFGGYATPAYGPLPSTEAPAEVGLTAAKETLERNDWEFSEETGTWSLAEEGLELRVTVRTANVAELRATADAVKRDWEALGVPVTIEFFEPSELAASVIRPREYDALLFGMVLGRDSDLFAFWSSSERNDPGLNVAMYANKRVDDLLEKLRTDGENRAELAEAAATIASDYPAVFTHAPNFVYHVPNDLHGVLLGAVASPSERFANAAFWYRQTEMVWPIFANASETETAD